MKNVHISQLKKLRLEHKWSQDQLAELSGLSIRTIQRIENGDKPSNESLKSLSAVFEVDFYISNIPLDTEEQDAYITKVKSFGNDAIAIIVLLVIMIFYIIENPENWDVFLFVLGAGIFVILSSANHTFDISKKLKDYFQNKKFNE